MYTFTNGKKYKMKDVNALVHLDANGIHVFVGPKSTWTSMGSI